MEDSPIGLDKWLMAMWLIVNCKNDISSYEIHRAIGVTQKSAWFLDHRIRLALRQGSSKSCCPANARLTKLLSAVRRGTCTRANKLSDYRNRNERQNRRYENLGARWTSSHFCGSESQKEGSAIGDPQACRSWFRTLYRCAAFLGGTGW